MFPAKNNPTVSLKSQSGQGIVEVVVVIALAAILILALVALAVRSNRSTNFSKAHDQAARLSQEGIEIIKSIKSSNAIVQTGSHAGLGNIGIKPNYDDPFNPCSNSDGTPDIVTGEDFLPHTWDQLFNVNVQDENAACISKYGRPGHFHQPGKADYGDAVVEPWCPGVTDPWCLHFRIPGNQANKVKVGNTIFTRTPYIADTPTPIGKSKCNVDSNDWANIKQFTVVVKWTDTAGDHEVANTACIKRLS